MSFLKLVILVHSTLMIMEMKQKKPTAFYIKKKKKRLGGQLSRLIIFLCMEKLPSMTNFLLQLTRKN